jgi:ubiquinone biosynthesis protein
MIEMLAPATRRLRPMDVIAHFEGVVMGELDLRLETSAAAEFAANTAKDDGASRAPVDWFLSLAAGDDARLGRGHRGRRRRGDRGGGTRPAALGERVLRLFLLHALRDGYFHADMHQGNLKVAPNGDIVALDFGIMGRLDDYTRRVYAEILFGFIRKDYRRVAEVHFEAGYVPPDRDIDEFARALRSVGEPIFGMDASPDLDGPAPELPLRGDRTLRDGDADRTHPAAAHDGGGRRRVAHAQPAHQHLEVAQPMVEDYIRGEHRAARGSQRSFPHGPGSGPLRPEAACAGGGCAPAPGAVAAASTASEPVPPPAHLRRGRSDRRSGNLARNASLGDAGRWALLSLLRGGGRSGVTIRRWGRGRR